MSKVNPADFIYFDEWQNLADYKYCNENSADKIPPGVKVIHCHLDEVHKLFKLLANEDRRFVLISSASDFGLCYQQENPPCMDYLKVVNFVKEIPSLGYKGLHLAPRCKVDNCNESDKYSIRMYMWTGATFNTIPANISKWFLTNCNVENEDGRLVPIPFGIQKETGVHIARLGPNSRSKTLYVNWTKNNLLRAETLGFYKSAAYDWVTVTSGRTHQEFVADLNFHTYTLCPSGNGFSGYRELEALYSDSIPLIQSHRSMSVYNTLPMFGIRDFEMTRLGKEFLESAVGRIDEGSFDMSAASLSYWKQQITNARDVL